MRGARARLPVKMDIKKIYLDSIGTKHPIRYQAERGLEWAYSFNAPDPVVRRLTSSLPLLHFGKEGASLAWFSQLSLIVTRVTIRKN